MDSSRWKHSTRNHGCCWAAVFSPARAVDPQSPSHTATPRRAACSQQTRGHRHVSRRRRVLQESIRSALGCLLSLFSCGQTHPTPRRGGAASIPSPRFPLSAPNTRQLPRRSGAPTNPPPLPLSPPRRPPDADGRRVAPMTTAGDGEDTAPVREPPSAHFAPVGLLTAPLFTVGGA